MTGPGAQLLMHRRRITWLSLLAVAALAWIFSPFPPFGVPEPARIVVVRDVSDGAGSSPDKAQAGYDHYYDRVNQSGAIVFSNTRQ